jgi:2-polyprenyl-6-methoxyphenol hydroxylase-like FAD-dependent oxidoreductase
VRIHFETEFLSFEQNVDGVVSTFKDHRHRRTAIVTSEFLIGADGARSMVREAIGAT